MLKVIIDILTPKQIMFFPRLAERLKKRGHRVWLTSRKYREVSQLLELKGIEATVVGEHGGKDLNDKLKASSQRIQELIPLFERIDPDATVSFSSPEMARASYGLGVPHICVNDSPHAVAVAKLTIPLSHKLLTPKMIPVEEWTKFGIAAGDVVQYNAIDPWVWLKDFEPDRSILDELGLNITMPIITIRPPETFAAYLLAHRSQNFSAINFIDSLLNFGEDVQIVAIPRYYEQIMELKKVFKDRITICESVIDGPSLLSYTDIFIGMGGTMSLEAVLLGIPTFNCYPGETLILDILIEKGLLEKESDPARLIDKISKLLNDLEGEKARRRESVERFVESFEDPIDIISMEIERTSEGH